MTTRFIQNLKKQQTQRKFKSCSCTDLVTRHSSDNQGEKYTYTACSQCGKQLGNVSYTANETYTQSDEIHQQDAHEDDQYKNYNQPFRRRRTRVRTKVENHYITRRASNIEFLGEFNDDVKELVLCHKDKLSIDSTISMREFYELVGD